MPKTVIFSPHRVYPPSKTAHYFNNLRLAPGSQVYSDDDVAALLAHPDYPRYKAWDAIAILEPQSEVVITPQQPGNSLSTYSVDDAETIVLNCHDAAQLQEWLKDEKRATLRQIINRRIKAIAEGA